MKKLFFLILVLAIFSGCDSGNSMSESEKMPTLESSEQRIYIGNSTPNGKPFHYPVLINESGDLKNVSELSQDELMLLKEQKSTYMSAKHKIRSALATNDPSNANDEILNILNKTQSHPLSHLLEQYASNKILNLNISTENGSLTNEQIGYYTNLLIKNQHPDSFIVYYSLQMLKNYWSDSKIKNAAEITVKACERELSKQKSKTELKELGYDDDFINKLKSKHTEISQYSDKLTEIIQNLN